MFRDPKRAMAPDPQHDLPPLDSVMAHPMELSFLLRLHHDCQPDRAHWHGQVQHLASGEKAEFFSLEDLHGWMALQVEQVRAAPR